MNDAEKIIAAICELKNPKTNDNKWPIATITAVLLGLGGVFATIATQQAGSRSR